MDEWHKRNPDNVVILSGDLLTTSNFPTINAMSQTNPNTEMLAGQLMWRRNALATCRPLSRLTCRVTPSSSRRLKTSRSTTSVAGLRRTIKEEPEYNRVATYQSSNDDFIVEDYGAVAFIDGITFAEAPAAGSNHAQGGPRPAVIGDESMLTPAQRHFQRVMAERHGKTDEQSDTARTARANHARLRMDQSALKRVQSDRAKAAMKRQLLPHYEGWIEGTLDGDSGRQDEVIVTLMVWAIDACDYVLAARIGRYVVAHGLLMPDRFNRTAATITVDEICDPILVQVKADDTTDVTPYLAVLDDVADFTAGSDMPRRSSRQAVQSACLCAA